MKSFFFPVEKVETGTSLKNVFKLIKLMIVSNDCFSVSLDPGPWTLDPRPVPPWTQLIPSYTQLETHCLDT